MPPGTNETNVPVPVFNLTAGATVDEGNNWINISWGPLSLVTPVSENTTPLAETMLANYAPGSGSSVIDYVTNGNSPSSYSVAPPNDFFETPRKTNLAVDVGAVEFTAATAPPSAALVPTPGGTPPNSANFGNWVVGNASLAYQYTYTNTGPTAITTTTVALTPGAGFAITANTLTACANRTLQPGNSCAVAVQFTPSATGTFNATLRVNGAVPASINLTGMGIAPTATLVLTAGPVAFGTVAEGSVSAQQQYTYTNTSSPATGGVFTITGGGTRLTEGTPPVNATDFSDSGPGIFASSCTNGKVLSPGVSCVINVQFNPHLVGVLNATLTITGPAAQSVTLTGTGSYTPSTVTFSGPVPALTTGGASNTAVRTGVVTVRNTGPGTVSMTAVPTVTRVTGTGTFALVAPATGTPCTAATNLASGGACTVGVRYTPPATGSATSTAHVSVTDTGAGALATTGATQNSANFTAN